MPRLRLMLPEGRVDVPRSCKFFCGSVRRDKVARQILEKFWAERPRKSKKHGSIEWKIEDALFAKKYSWLFRVWRRLKLGNRWYRDWRSWRCSSALIRFRIDVSVRGCYSADKWTSTVSTDLANEKNEKTTLCSFSGLRILWNRSRREVEGASGMEIL